MPENIKNFSVIQGGANDDAPANKALNQELHNKSKQNLYVEDLYYKHKTSLSQYLKNVLPNIEDVDEIMHETYIRLLNQESLEKLDENARAYLFTVATNLARDQFRKRANEFSKEHIPVENVNLINQDMPPERMLEWEKSLNLLKQEIMKLKPLTRQIFILHRFDEMTYPEIAKKVGVSTRTVERHMFKALQGLQHCLRDLI